MLFVHSAHHHKTAMLFLLHIAEMFAVDGKVYFTGIET